MLSNLGIEIEEKYGDELIEDDEYVTPGFGPWKFANKNALCPNGCGPVSVIRFKQYSEVDWDWFIAEHFCNSCMMSRELGLQGGYDIAQLKAYAAEYDHRA